MDEEFFGKGKIVKSFLKILIIICLVVLFPSTMKAMAGESATVQSEQATITVSAGSSTATGAAITYTGVQLIEVEGLSENREDMEENRTIMQNYLDEVKENQEDGTLYRLVVPKGTYYLSGYIKIYSNTWLDLTAGVTFKKGKASAGLVRCGLGNEASPTGYSSVENILIDGGCFDGNIAEFDENYLINNGISDSLLYFSLFRISHAQNIILRNVELNGDTNGHHLEICSSKGISVYGCSFKNYTGSKVKEAIQIEVANSDDNASSCEAFDDTICQNILIYKNTFSNLAKGIGNHFVVYGIYNKGIEIKDNTFSDIANAAVNPIGSINVAIENNTMKNVGRGVSYTALASSIKTANDPSKAKIVSSVNLVIRNNTITVSNSKSVSYNYNYAIYISGSDYQGKTYALSAVTIMGNTIHSYDAGIYLKSVSNSSVTNNKITESKKNSANNSIANGIVIKSASSNTVSGNTIGSSSGYKIEGCGIYIQDCKSHTVSNNKIYKTKTHGIYIAGDSNVNLLKDYVSGASGQGLKVMDGATVSVTGGSYTNCKKNGVYLSKSTLSMKQVKVCNNSSNGICVEEKSVLNIQNSKINANGNHGVGVYHDSQVKFSKNTISKNKENGISVVGATVNIYNNKLENNKANGISISEATSKSVIGGKSKGNQVNNNSGYGIIILQKSNVVVANNTCKNNESGVYIGTESKALLKKNKVTKNNTGITLVSTGQVTIKGNTITKNKSTGLSLYSVSKAVKMTNNTLCNKGTYEIYKSSSSGKNTNTTIKKMKLKGIKAKSKTIKGKTLKNTKLVLYRGNKKIASVKTDKDGKFTVKLKKKLKKGEIIKVKLKDTSGNSILRTIVVK
ncbi:parallel beta-helix repeat (two copies) [Eubacterium oxidoreducens]|uniref:Parallel beta-helix repeat (Two copies) n=2 Tax=Eubacterium oxidoreducens TaxID=1732 RepID=A0A1G6ADC4_EUBOX|nr:parallel beta-helix repeat (two copies) [Eubacterium oxidoreducens]